MIVEIKALKVARHLSGHDAEGIGIVRKPSLDLVFIGKPLAPRLPLSDRRTLLRTDRGEDAQSGAKICHRAFDTRHLDSP